MNLSGRGAQDDVGRRRREAEPRVIDEPRNLTDDREDAFRSRRTAETAAERYGFASLLLIFAYPPSLSPREISHLFIRPEARFHPAERTPERLNRNSTA